MIITDVRYYPYRVPFRRPFTTAHGTLLAREGVIVELVTDAGASGYGDMAAVTEFGAPDVATLLHAARQIRSFLIAVALDEALNRISESIWGRGIFALLPSPLLFALETSVHTAWQREMVQPEQRESASLTGWLSKPVRVNATIGAAQINEAVMAASEALAAGFTCIKLKVGMMGDVNEEVTRIMAVRDAIGPTTQLRLDANEAWSFEDALSVIKSLQTADIQFLEQPLARADVVGMQRLHVAGEIPIAGDEMFTDYASVRHNKDAADILVLKPQLLGGQTITEKVMRHFKRQKKLVLTSSLETGIGVAATLGIANYPGVQSQLLECGLATLPLLEDDLIQETLVVKDGMMYPPPAPVTPDWDALARYRLEVDGL